MTDDAAPDYEAATPDETVGATLARAMGDAGAVLVAQGGGKIVGAVVLILVHGEPDPDTAHVASHVDITVTPSLPAYAVQGALWRALRGSETW